MRILVFGASITQGFFDTEGGWVNRLRKHYDTLNFKKLAEHSYAYPSIFNLGISGDTTKKLLARFEHETIARKWPGEEFVFVFSVGTNNAVEQNGKLWSTPELYRRDITALVSLARKYSHKIMFVGLSSCDERLTQPVGWDPSISYTNKRIKSIENEMDKLCIRESLPFVPVFAPFSEQLKNGKLFLADGLHPNNDGHAFMASLVLPVLDKLTKRSA